MALQQIDSLSGGQKSRVAFAVLCGHNPNFLVLGKFYFIETYVLSLVNSNNFSQFSFYHHLNPCELEILDLSTVGFARMSKQRSFRSLMRYMSARS